MEEMARGTGWMIAFSLCDGKLADSGIGGELEFATRFGLDMKSTLLTILIAALINLSFVGFARSQTTNISRNAAKIKSRVAKIGVDTKTVTVKLNDGSKVKGKITEINDESFLINAKPIRYDDVKSVSTPANAWLAVVGVASLVGIIAFLACAAKECGNLR